jgi:hypothetical protein
MTQVELRLANRTTADLLPQPQGSFAELNNKRQAVNNQTLAIGIVMLLSGLIGVLFFNLNLKINSRNICLFVKLFILADCHGILGYSIVEGAKG